MAAEHLMIVGKGGVGKSTTAANLAAALAEAGKRVLVMGYDARCNSTATLRGRRQLLPLPGWSHAETAPLCAVGYHHTLCLEAGELLQDGGAEQAARLLWHPLVVDYAPEFIIHDYCRAAGKTFSLPATIEGAVQLFMVTSAEMASIEVVNDTFSWLNTVSAVECRFGGIIVNNLSCALYDSIISDYAGRTGSAVVGRIPHSLMVSVSDFHNRTVMEAAPLSTITFAYRKIIRSILVGESLRRPRHLPRAELKKWAVEWGDIIAELETGVVRDGSAI